MLRIVIIGGTGHVGTYLVPRLVHSGHEVLSISRGESKPYRNHPAWESVEHVRLDRAAEEAAGDFAERVRSLRPDVVIDMICFELESARQLVEALRGARATLLALRHYLGARPQYSGPDNGRPAPLSLRGVWHQEGTDRGLPAR